MIHASELRAETMHDARQRQLLALAAALLLALCCCAPSAQAAARRPRRAKNCSAAKLIEVALFARQAGAEEWQKLEHIYADLAAKYPRDAAVRNAHAEFLWSRGEHDARDGRMAGGGEARSGRTPTVLDHLGGSFLAAGDAKKAAAYYARAVASAPDERRAITSATPTSPFSSATSCSTPPIPMATRCFAMRSRISPKPPASQPLDPEYARAYAETFYSVPEPDWHAALRAWQHFYEISPAEGLRPAQSRPRPHETWATNRRPAESLARIQSPEFDRLKTRLERANRDRIDPECRQHGHFPE